MSKNERLDQGRAKGHGLDAEAGVEALQPVRIDRADGIRYVLGPPTKFGPLRVPGWIQVEVAGQRYLRMRVRGAQTAAPASTSFDPSWLVAPGPAAPAPGAAATELRTQ